MRSLRSHLFVIGFIVVGLCSHASAQFQLDPGLTQTGTIVSAAQINTYTFSANKGDVYDFTVAATTGDLSPEIRVYNSIGMVIASAADYNCSGSTIELNTVLIPASGTYTVHVSDCSATNTGGYVLYAQRINNPYPPVAEVTFGQTLTGVIGSAAESNTYTFSATANDEVDFTLSTTSGGTLSPKIRLYNSAGTLVNSAANYNCSGSTLEMNTVTLPVTGTYTVLVGDCGDTNTGDYEIYTQRTDNRPEPIALLFGHAQIGTIGSVAQSNTYTFSANAKDIAYFTLSTTSGGLSPKIRLYNPDGSLNSSSANYNCSGSTLEMTTGQLPKSGTYTVLIGDCADSNTGNYEIYSQRTNDPGGIVIPLTFGQTQNGMIGSVAQSNTYTFSANAKDIAYFTLSTTSGGLSPKIRLYNPDGSLNSSSANYNCSGSTLEMTTGQLPKSGTYTVLIGDCADSNTGNYEIYSQRTNDPGGAVPVAWGQVQTGKITSAAQSNTYTFTGVPNDSVEFTVVTTSGTLSPKIRLYNPDGSLNSSAANYNCSGSTIQMNQGALSQEGTYTVLVGDCADTNTGSYNLSSECFGTCPLTAQVPPPEVSPDGGTYFSPLSVKITDNPGATIYYTTNGSTPTTKSTPYKGPIPVSAAETIKAIAVAAGYTNSAVVSATYTFMVASPVFSPPGGTYTSPQVVKITDTTPGATIYYTTNGSTPTAKSTPYKGPILVSTTETIKAIAVAAGYTNSAVVSATYTFMVASPVFSPPGGTYTSPQVVKITDTTPGATIYYTTNGSTPTARSTPYKGPILVSTTETIKAIAVAAGYTNSAVASATYTFMVASPVFSPAGGTYTFVQTVTLRDETMGAVIYYTTNGKAPTAASTKYTGPITVSASETIEAIAVAADYANSTVAKATYDLVGSPSALSAPATSVGTTDATLNAVVNTLGLSGFCIFQYGTSSTALSSSTAKTALSPSTTPVKASFKLTNLKSKTTYYFRVVVTTAAGTGSDAALRFTTN